MMSRRESSVGRRIELITAPSSLGLRPNQQDREPETWCAPAVLLSTGLAALLNAPVSPLEHPLYEFTPQFGTRILNGLSIRRFSLALAARVADVRARGAFPIVLGGDCSILLGCLLGTRHSNGKGLDLDVLDQASLPAVDSPGTPGLDFEALELLLATLVSSGRIAGIDFTIYDPGLDPGHAHAERIAQCFARSVASVLRSNLDD
jgi:arginase family enzyme